MNQDNENHECAYCDCENEATEYNTALEAWVCDAHVDGGGGDSGYCSRDCKLGYDCDGSC